MEIVRRRKSLYPKLDSVVKKATMLGHHQAMRLLSKRSTTTNVKPLPRKHFVGSLDGPWMLIQRMSTIQNYVKILLNVFMKTIAMQPGLSIYID